MFIDKDWVDSSSYLQTKQSEQSSMKKPKSKEIKLTAHELKSLRDEIQFLRSANVDTRRMTALSVTIFHCLIQFPRKAFPSGGCF